MLSKHVFCNEQTNILTVLQAKFNVTFTYQKKTFNIDIQQFKSLRTKTNTL
jgi:hypothetical protein